MMETPSSASRYDGRWSWCPDTDELIVDECWYRSHGLAGGSDRPPTLSDWVSRLHPEDGTAFEANLAALSRRHRAENEFDVRVRHGDGHWIWLLIRARIDGAETGARRVIRGTLQDITDRKRHEAILRDEHFFLGRVEHAPGVGSWEVELPERRIVWSDETCRIHGLGPGHRPSYEEAINYFTPSARPVVRGCFEQAIAGGEPFDIELPLTRADGRRITVRCMGSVEHRDGSTVRIGGAMQDVTEHTARQLERISDSHEELERVNERLSIATSAGGIGLWDLDLGNGEFVWNAEMFRLYGLDETGDRVVSAAQWLRRVRPDDRARLRHVARGAVAGHGPDTLEFHVVTATGQERVMLGTSRVITDPSGRPLRLVGTNQDVTDARRLTRDLARQHEILEVTLRSIGDGVITTDPDNRVIWMNPVAERMLGWTTVTARGRPLSEVFDVIDGETREPITDPVRDCIGDERVRSVDEHRLLISKEGETRWIESTAGPIRNDQGELYGAVLVFHDVTEQRSIASEMTWRATHDALTGLVDRGEFESILKRLHGTTLDGGGAHALLFIDLDQFKIVNDTCGHAAGDQLLKQVSNLLEHTVRSDDIVARLGGDEFAVILELCSGERARAIAQQICERMSEYRFIHREQRFRIGASIGLVCVDRQWSDVSAIIRAADTACYAAKEAGRNQVYSWSETDQSTRTRHVQTTWATRLVTALDDDRFELHAQRIERLAPNPDDAPERRADGHPAPSDRDRPTGHAEILLRLRDDQGRIVLPGAFLPAAERFNLINRIDQWVLARVIAWLETHRDDRSVGTLWVNLSGQSVEDRRFQEETLARLGRADAELCRSLCLEITETAAIRSFGETARFIQQLRQLGVRVALDDFGAGASSFGYLKNLPVDYLKIDGQFVRDVTADPLDDAAVRCFAEVARIMGIETVAEFVETPQVLDRLKVIGVDYVQGWLLHEPGPIDELSTRWTVETAEAV